MARRNSVGAGQEPELSMVKMWCSFRFRSCMYSWNVVSFAASRTCNVKGGSATKQQSYTSGRLQDATSDSVEKSKVSYLLAPEEDCAPLPRRTHVLGCSSP